MSTHNPQKNMHKYTIKEAAELSSLPESTLRYYETMELNSPIYRDSSSKHRLYSEDDINKITIVACLNASDMSISDMKSYIQNMARGNELADDQIQLLQQHKKYLSHEAKRIALRRKYIDLKILYWKALQA